MYGGHLRLNTKKEVRTFHKACMKAIVNRESQVVINGTAVSLWKWFRPWSVVPELTTWAPPVGDYGIGVEVEMGFNSREAAQAVAEKVHRWRNITLDFEGGSHPIEATFPPVLYSKFGPNSQASRYLKLLKNAGNDVRRHDPESCVGTHINVSKGGTTINYDKIRSINGMMEGLLRSDKLKYFGREYPYGYGYVRGNNTYVEWKMFNSTTDWKRLRQYVDIAVELVELATTSRRITPALVREALERGFNKHPLS